MTKSQYEWLARRFENMTAKEALLFRGAMQIEQPQATCDVMQIANQLEHYELLYGAGNDFALGNFVMEHIFYCVFAACIGGSHARHCSGQ